MVKRTITQQQWETLKEGVKETIFAILEAVDVLINHTKLPSYVKDNTPFICAALYTHAVEEYGKLLLLQSYQPINGKVEIDMGRFTDHPYKFNLAIAKLPDNCKVLHEGSYSSETFSSQTYDTDTVADWDARLKILNTDIDDKGDVIKPAEIDLDRLQKAVFDFRTEMYGVKI